MTRRLRLTVALVAATAVILSAPFFQQLFTAVSTSWGPQSRVLGIAATVVPVAIAMGAAVARIRERRALRYLTLSLSLLLGAGYVVLGALSFTECFHFAEYGLLTWLFYRSSILPGASRASAMGRSLHAGDDLSVLVLPLLAGVMVGTLDEWFQWFIPVRAGEARDIALNGVAGGCGLLFAVSIEPPDRLTGTLRTHSRRRVGICAAAAVTLFALFFFTVHVGYEVQHDEVGSFRSRYTADQLVALARDRAQRWTAEPPVTLRRLSREDQYLSEGLWRVQRRNEAWSAGDLSTAWRENRILESFYAPILDSPSYAGLLGHRWPADQRVEAEERPGIDRTPQASDAYPYPLFVWQGTD